MRTHRVGISFSDRIAIAKNEILCAVFVIADALDRREAKEPDWERLILVLQRLRAVSEDQ